MVMVKETRSTCPNCDLAAVAADRFASNGKHLRRGTCK
uniref:Uncharacterized protein n=1 Tax=Curvibacter symbiont subsp. Hydra magnipapillata TaxID=667019 RepID=C9YGK6_CURXX|nr:hypothetical protein Csp_B19060 [Curvibacter putative symbiont of Hydra magnipapillata]